MKGEGKDESKDKGERRLRARVRVMSVRISLNPFSCLFGDIKIIVTAMGCLT